MYFPLFLSAMSCRITCWSWSATLCQGEISKRAPSQKKLRTKFFFLVAFCFESSNTSRLSVVASSPWICLLWCLCARTRVYTCPWHSLSQTWVSAAWIEDAHLFVNDALEIIVYSKRRGEGSITASRLRCANRNLLKDRASFISSDFAPSHYSCVFFNSRKPTWQNKTQRERERVRVRATAKLECISALFKHFQMYWAHMLHCCFSPLMIELSLSRFFLFCFSNLISYLVVETIQFESISCVKLWCVRSAKQFYLS